MSAVLEHAMYADLYKGKDGEQGEGNKSDAFRQFMSADFENSDKERSNANTIVDQSPVELSKQLMKLKFYSNGQLGRCEASWEGDASNVPGTDMSKGNFIATIRDIDRTPSKRPPLPVSVAVNRYNFVVAYINEHTNLDTTGSAIKSVASVSDIKFLPRGTLNNGLYGVSAGEYDLHTARTVRLNQLSTQPILYPQLGLGVLGGEGQVGGRVITDRLSYCSDNKFLRNHYDGQKASLEEAGIKLSPNSEKKVQALFNNLERIQVQICKLLRQRELAISGSGEHTKATLDAIAATNDETSFNVVLGDLVKAHRRANQKGLSLIITLEKVIADQLEAVLDKRAKKPDEETTKFSGVSDWDKGGDNRGATPLLPALPVPNDDVDPPAPAETPQSIANELRNKKGNELEKLYENKFENKLDNNPELKRNVAILLSDGKINEYSLPAVVNGFFDSFIYK